MKYQLKDFHRNIPDEDLLEDLKRVANKLQSTNLSSRDYNNKGGKFTSGTISNRFGGWNKALEKAGLGLAQQRNISEEELFKNIEQVWIKIGRQPVFRDIKVPISNYSTAQYVSRFGTWRKALEAFIEFINSNTDDDSTNESLKDSLQENSTDEVQIKHKTKRFPSERLKVQVLMRDGNKCRLCGLTLIGDDIHFDHIFPWSKGGETVLENLQILCSKHNIAKSNLEYPIK
ncbi:hypothetical protein CH371_11145 [Leptospira wolffii]|uniref:HNH nuclease domain-containing protein n=1 Tax=Leptospira wolffii TaxID=409998 RepID=A0A2M9ZCH0_9LEPT|nr:HNH endonuclease [Leptospira wolffii]PJZ66062.1 hypothetical protein CH371_11145 [Leptospira wolffii]